MQADVLDRRPDNGQTTGFGREGVDLIGALSHIALRDFRSLWWSECVDASSRVNAKNVNVFSSSSARLLTASG